MATDLASAQRRVLYELSDRAAIGGGRRVLLPIMLPYSLLVNDGVEYVETNSTASINEGGGFHVVPSHGVLVGSSYAERSLGIGSDGSTIHKLGWI